jgi:hypothetical protein
MMGFSKINPLPHSDIPYYGILPYSGVGIKLSSDEQIITNLKQIKKLFYLSIIQWHISKCYHNISSARNGKKNNNNKIHHYIDFFSKEPVIQIYIVLF